MTHQTAALQGDRTANEVLSHAKLVRWVWAACNELATAVVDCWPAELPRLQRSWCAVFLSAAQAADAMQGSVAVTEGAPSIPGRHARCSTSPHL